MMAGWLENQPGIKKTGLQPLPYDKYCGALNIPTQLHVQMGTAALQPPGCPGRSSEPGFFILPGERTARAPQTCELWLQALSTGETLQGCWQRSGKHFRQRKVEKCGRKQSSAHTECRIKHMV